MYCDSGDFVVGGGDETYSGLLIQKQNSPGTIWLEKFINIIKLGYKQNLIKEHQLNYFIISILILKQQFH